MAIEKVEAQIGENQGVLQETEERVYEGSLNAPRESGKYAVEVRAYDDKGNVGISTAEMLSVTLWHEPKTNWTQYDRFNVVDFNRIKNNLLYLHEKAEELWRLFSIEPMRGDVLDETENIYAKDINAIEKNLDIINQNVLTQDYGISKTFYPNGIFIDYVELNRIESATLSIKGILDRQEKTLRRLPFRLGTYKEVRI